jgi:hypothetical protein
MPQKAPFAFGWIYLFPNELAAGARQKKSGSGSPSS